MGRRERQVVLGEERQLTARLRGLAEQGSQDVVGTGLSELLDRIKRSAKARILAKEGERTVLRIRKLDGTMGRLERQSAARSELSSERRTLSYSVWSMRATDPPSSTLLDFRCEANGAELLLIEGPARRMSLDARAEPGRTTDGAAISTGKAGQRPERECLLDRG